MNDISRRDFIKLGALLGTGGASLMLGGCGNTGSASSTSATAQSSAAGSTSASAGSTGPKTLVAYYSAQGHTKAVAQTLADEIGAEIFEIVPQDPYTEDDLEYNDSTSRVSREHEDESQQDVPLAQTAPDNFTDFDTVLVGFPIWWGDAAWPTNRFASDNDFTGKDVITFCTSASSGLGSSTQTLASLAGAGDWQDGERFSSSASDSDVRTWAQSLNL